MHTVVHFFLPNHGHLGSSVLSHGNGLLVLFAMSAVATHHSFGARIYSSHTPAMSNSHTLHNSRLLAYLQLSGHGVSMRLWPAISIIWEGLSLLKMFTVFGTMHPKELSAAWCPINCKGHYLEAILFTQSHSKGNVKSADKDEVSRDLSGQMVWLI
jgi:hypothetical protein